MKSKTLIERIIYNPIVQTIVIFISGGWIILEITEYFIENFGLNETARNIVLIALIVLLPVSVFFAWYLNRKNGTFFQKTTLYYTEKDSVKEWLKKNKYSVRFPLSSDTYIA